MRIVPLSAVLLLAFAAHAEIYKWVDEKGVTHYGESPPQDSKASKVEVRTSPAAVAKPESSQDWSKRELEFRKRQIDREAAEKTDERNRQRREHECIRARQLLGFESSPGRHWQMNDKGEKVFLTDEQQAAAVESARRKVDELCR